MKDINKPFDVKSVMKIMARAKKMIFVSGIEYMEQYEGNADGILLEITACSPESNGINTLLEDFTVYLADRGEMAWQLRINKKLKKPEANALFCFG